MNAATLTHTNSQPLAISQAASHSRALRFLTAGSVDDGKSTLIGRLLLDSQAIMADQWSTLEQRAAGAPVDLSLLTDGLEAEREQGITIDVAYRYFATPHRKFIIADAPGHEQYTRNMVTAAAGSDAAIVLVDLTKVDWRQSPVDLLPQTRRHTLLAHLLRVPSIVFAVNKLDAVDEPARAFKAVSKALQDFAQSVGIVPAGIVPVSALRGDNVALPLNADWYHGPTLLGLLESLASVQEDSEASMAMPVQYVARQGDGANPERVFWGRVARGGVQAGDSVLVLPAGHKAQVKAVRRAGQVVGRATAGESAGLVLDRHVDVSRGDWLVAAGAADAQAPAVASSFNATLAWLDTEPAQLGRRYLVRHGHRWVQAIISHIHHRLDIQSLQKLPAQELGVNDIGLVTIELQSAVPIDAYRSNRVTGAMIVVDPTTHRTSGALLVEQAA